MRSPIRSVIIRVINKSDDRAAGVRFVNGTPNLCGCPSGKKFVYAPVSIQENVAFDKNIILATFSFTSSQETINRQTTEGCSIKFIAYVDLKNFREIWPKHSRDNNKQNHVGKFYFPHLRNTSRILFATRSLDDISLTNQNI